MMGKFALPPSMSGVLYAEDFDEPLLQAPAQAPAAARPAPEPEKSAPSFSLSELRAAAEAAHQRGRDEALREAATSMTTQRNLAAASLVKQLAATQQQAAQAVEQALSMIARTSLSLLSVALPALCADHAEAELCALLHRIVPPMRQQPELHIRVHASLRAVLEEETAAMLEGSGTHVTWTSSSKLMRGDIAISWQNGGALRDTASTCDYIRDAVLALFEAGQETVPEADDVERD